MPKVKPLSFDDVTTVSLKHRQSKVSIDLFGKRYVHGQTVAAFMDSLPKVLGAQDLREVVERIAAAKKEQKTVLLGMGAHVIKVGLSPIVIQLMEAGVADGVAMHGAGAIHDVEVALEGRTSEDVDQELDRGSFGMSGETAAFINEAVAAGNKQKKGVGASLGDEIMAQSLPYADVSIVAAGARLGIPVMVHVAFGTDIVHLHPSFNAGAWGEATYQDFRQFCAMVSTLERGVYLNVGSAVILPEVFLKAMTVVRNKGFVVDNITTVNMDFIRHYRPLTNVVTRPVRKGGRGYNLVGHHEIMLPLLAAGVLERLAGC